MDCTHFSEHLPSGATSSSVCFSKHWTSGAVKKWWIQMCQASRCSRVTGKSYYTCYCGVWTRCVWGGGDASVVMLVLWQWRERQSGVSLFLYLTKSKIVRLLVVGRGTFLFQFILTLIQMCRREKNGWLRWVYKTRRTIYKRVERIITKMVQERRKKFLLLRSFLQLPPPSRSSWSNKAMELYCFWRILTFLCNGLQMF